MADFEINNPVTFTKNVRKFETKDKGHADVFNRVTAALVNNDAYLEESKVDKVEGKGLSTNDYTNADKNKLSGIEEGAEVNVQADWNVSDSNSNTYIKNKPKTMKNPNTLDIKLNSVSQGAYDGSSQKSINITAKNVGADSSGTAETKVFEHNTSEAAHADMRNLITTLTNRLNALADSDDTTLDQLSEIVAYIKNNKSLIDGITTSKVNVSDIIDNLTSSATNKPLAARQGKVLKDLIAELTSIVDGKVNKAGDSMTGTLNSSLMSTTHLQANKGNTIINSIAPAGEYTMLDKLNSTNGYFTDGVYEGKRIFNYTKKETVDSGCNAVTHSVILLDENADSYFPGVINASRGNFKGDIEVASRRSDTLRLTVPAAGRIDDTILIPQGLSDCKTFLGSITDENSVFWNMISIRHGNGWNDGQYFGMYIRSLLLGEGSHGGSLLWNKQMGSNKGWLGERVLLDSVNYKDFCLPLSNESLIAENSVYRISLLSKVKNTDRCGVEAYTKENGRTGGLYFYNGNAILKSYNMFSIDVTEDVDVARAYYFDADGLYPIIDHVDLGKSSFHWRNIYANNGTIQTSDRTKKKNIKSLDIKKIKSFVMGLKPSSYKMANGTSGRTHWGFIAQDIEKLMKTLNMDSKDFAGFIKSQKKVIKYVEYKDKNGNKVKKQIEEVIEGEYDYALRYDEFIAPLIAVVQEHEEKIQKQQETINKQQKEIEELKKEMKELKEIVLKIA